MQLSRPLLAVLIVICTVVILAANATVLRGSAAASSQTAWHNQALRRALRSNSAGDGQPTVAPSELLAFVGVFTALKPERRQSLRETWFPSTPDLLQQYGKLIVCCLTGGRVLLAHGAAILRALQV